MSSSFVTSARQDNPLLIDKNPLKYQYTNLKTINMPPKRPKTKPEDREARIKRALDKFQQEDESYLNVWVHEAISGHKRGIYQAISKALELKPGSAHLDLGCGMGNLLYQLKHDYPQAIAVGAEKNNRLIRASLLMSDSFGIRPEIYHNEFVCLDRHGKVYTIFDTPENMAKREDLTDCAQIAYSSFTEYKAPEGKDLLSPDESIKIVADDIRSMTMLKHLLAGRQVDSASITLPGSGGRVAYEAPYDLPRPGKTIEEEIGVARIMDAVQDSVQRAIANLQDILKPGGTLLTADRIKQLDDKEEMKMAVAYNTRLRFGDQFENWEPQDIGFTTLMEKPEKAPDWNYIRPGAGNPENNKSFDRENLQFSYMIQTFRKK